MDSPPGTSSTSSAPTAKVSTRRNGLSRRSPRACESCRARKVRCDVTKTKSPCTNCRLDNKTCVLPVSKRRHAGDRVLCPSLLLEASKNGKQSPICDVVIDFDDVRPATGTRKYSIQDSRGRGTTTLADKLTLSPKDLGTLPIIDFFTPPDSKSQSSKPDPGASYPSPTSTVASDPWQTALPAYITPVSRDIPPDDLDFLRSKGAFEIPDAPTRDLLLQAYMQWVHPFTPMLDLEGILTAVFSNGRKRTVSLLVFQSLLFAATAYLGNSLEEGSRRSVRKSCFNRARLLYDFDVESDRLAIVQSAILLSFWDGDSGTLRDSYHWIGVATMHAGSLGWDSNLDLTPSPSAFSVTTKLTWWSLLIRDRLMAVTLRRPVQFKPPVTRMPSLEIQDFRSESLHQTIKETSLIQGANPGDCEILAECCIALAQLALHIDKVLSSHYEPQRTQGASGKRPSTISLIPCTGELTDREINICGDELQRWFRRLPLSVLSDQSQGVSPGAANECRVVRVHQALLMGYYCMTLMTIYRPLTNPSSRGQTSAELTASSARIVCQAAKSITDIFRNLYAEDLVQVLPETAIAALEPTAVTHLLYSMSQDAMVREISFQNFYLCWRILLEFAKTYRLADTTIAMLNAAAHRLKEDAKQPMMEAAGSPMPVSINVLDSSASDTSPAMAEVGSGMEDSGQQQPHEWDHTSGVMTPIPDLVLDDLDQLLQWDTMELNW
ncbi:hypothetical protein PV08_02193 [Exophiala spinifera]|uniref:Zn(2)-C6 fungal-type domain-containing protein n=1 Tax=Exophiala spinifera TaxID=91928 RepID=A0A0D2BRD2_9EURO|nr:uncharacterized protein PV08_02193 [Exophiala spinifera]KIW21613.1 hypothetical protein PV08_02193 [Exophiala spinifera]